MLRKHVLYLSSLFTFCLLLPSAVSAQDLITQNPEVSGFTGVRLETLGSLRVNQGDEAVVLEFSPKFEGKIRTRVEDGVLIISGPRQIAGLGGLQQNRGDVLNYTVTLPELSELALEGSGDVTLGAFETEELAIALGGSGDITAEGLDVGTLELALGGSGDVGVAGQTDSLDLGLAGSGDVDASGLQANSADVGLTGSGDVSVCVSETLEVGLLGSGDVTYYGDAEPEVGALGSGEAVAGGDCP